MKRLLQFCCFSSLVLLSASSFGQTPAEYLDQQFNVLPTIEKAKYTREVSPKADSIYNVIIKLVTGETKMLGTYTDPKLENEYGDFVYYYDNGNKESEGRFKNGYKVGVWKRWSSDGAQKPDRYYPDEDFKPGKRTTAAAKFPGGMAALQQLVNDSLKYPVEAKERQLEGTVYVTFTIDATGEVSRPEVSGGIHYLLDEEALRFVSSFPTWIPAAKDGMPVDSSYIMPITFDLGHGSSSNSSSGKGSPSKN